MALILAIDDEASMRRLVRRALEGAGHTVMEAANGRDGIALLRARPADLVITDIVMPEMEGIETIRTIRREFSALRIIAISGGGSAEGSAIFLDAAAKFGADMVLSKPFRAAELVAAVEAVLQSRR